MSIHNTVPFEVNSRELLVKLVDGGTDFVQSTRPMRFRNVSGGGLLIEERREGSKIWYFRKLLAPGSWQSVEVMGEDRFAYFSK